jgi:hypothetical protein
MESSGLETKPFWQTSEFYFAAFVAVITGAGMLLGRVDFATGLGILTGNSGLYGLARGIAKSGVRPGVS